MSLAFVQAYGTSPLVIREQLYHITSLANCDGEAEFPQLTPRQVLWRASALVSVVVVLA